MTETAAKRDHPRVLMPVRRYSAAELIAGMREFRRVADEQDSGLITGDDGVARCRWGDTPEIYRAYHDEEWGFPVDDEHRLFEKLCLEGFQAGLSWLTILRKRESFRAAFAGFDYEQVARFGARDVKRLLADAAI